MYFERKSTICVGANRFFGNDFWTSLFSSSDLLSVKPIFLYQTEVDVVDLKGFISPGASHLSNRVAGFDPSEEYAQVKLDHIPAFQGKNQTSCSNHHHLEIFDTPQT